jgi:hypothetical protein
MLKKDPIFYNVTNQNSFLTESLKPVFEKKEKLLPFFVF